MRRVPLGTQVVSPPLTERASAPAGQLGGLTRRSGPEAGLRPTVLFALAGSLTAGLGRLRGLGLRPVARRARGCSRAGAGLGDPDPARVHPRPRDRLHALHAARQPVPRAGARCPRALAGRPVAGCDGSDRGPERGRRDRADARARSPGSPIRGRSRSCSPTTARPTAPRSSGKRPRRRLGLDYRRVVRAGARQAPGAQHGARHRDDADRGHGRRGHAVAARVDDVPRRPADDRAAGPARLRVRRCAGRPEPAPALHDADAAVGLPARDQRREADAGVVQHARSSRKGRSRRTGRTTCARWAAGRTRSGRTSC